MSVLESLTVWESSWLLRSEVWYHYLHWIDKKLCFWYYSHKLFIFHNRKIGKCWTKETALIIKNGLCGLLSVSDFYILWKVTIVRTKRAQCVRVREAVKGLLGQDPLHSGPEPRSRVVRKWHSCPCSDEKWQDWTGQHTQECLSLPLSLSFSLPCLVPLSPVLEKHLLSALREFIKAFRSLWLPLFHTDFLWLVSFFLSLSLFDV